MFFCTDMGFIKINGNDFEKMLHAGLQIIRDHEIEVNDMNVFPVPDGDTGSNLRMTLQNGIEQSPSNVDLGKYLLDVKKGMLLGARGNSGVILSQLFTGIADSLEHEDSADCFQFSKALTAAFKTAYKSVINPVEGTILSVAREGAEKVASTISTLSSLEEVLEQYVSEMKESLKKTPELLPILKESGVLDSGAAGYIYIFDGMLRGLKNEIVANDFTIESANQNASPVFDSQRFNRDSKFEDGYCTEFILQLLADEKYEQDFDIDLFIKKLQELGNSIVAFRTDDRVKVHIHTMKPYLVIELAQRYGEFVTFKMDNMQIQHNEHDFVLKKKKTVHKEVAIIAVVNGEGLKDLYGSFGCDVIIESGPTMNTSSQEFIGAFEQVDADNIVVLPNNKNIFFAAKQAVEISGKQNVVILETENPVEGYYALAMGQVVGDFENQISLMKNGIENVDVMSVTIASKDYVQNNINCKKDDFIALVNGQLVSSGKYFRKTVMDAVKSVPGFDSKECCMIVTGNNATDEMTSELSSSIDECLPGIEINMVDGGQEIFLFMIGF